MVTIDDVILQDGLEIIYNNISELKSIRYSIYGHYSIIINFNSNIRTIRMKTGSDADGDYWYKYIDDLIENHG